MISLSQDDRADGDMGAHYKLLEAFFSEFRDRNDFADFCRIEKLVESLKGGGSTISGHPAIRPRDCGKITQELRGIFERGKPQFRLHDPSIVQRFERVIGEFTSYCASVYPSEASAALVLHGQVLMYLGEPEKVLEVVERWVVRPYALEGADHVLELADLYFRANLRLGALRDLALSPVALGDWLAANLRIDKLFRIGMTLAPYVGIDPAVRKGSLRARLIGIAAARLLKAMRTHGAPLGWLFSFVRRSIWRSVLLLCFIAGARRSVKRSPYALRMNPAGTTLVARGMGGIGDLLMMEPGLEALAAKQGSPVDFAIPKKFFAIFKGNPHIRLLDIHGPPLDMSYYRYFVNLSICPASRYESGVRPFIKKGRVEVFARAMGVKRKELMRQGWHIHQYPQKDDADFCDHFLAEKGLGVRKLVGVAPYSRDSYKDYPAIGRVIEELSREHDVLIFHHVQAGLPEGPGIASTAGLSLEKSLALVGRLSAMVSVDSAFLHAAAAYDFPVISLFGPTDGRPLTRHHQQPIILSKPEIFRCVPCWRNEDSPCTVAEINSGALKASGALNPGVRSETLVSSNTISPCVAAILPEEVVSAVNAAIGQGR